MMGIAAIVFFMTNSAVWDASLDQSLTNCTRGLDILSNGTKKLPSCTLAEQAWIERRYPS